MNPTAVELFYGILAIAALVAVVAIVGIRLIAFVSAGGRDLYASVARAIEPNAMAMAWFVALLATMGSLYFSEVAGFVPCKLCWYQRIAMYPLVVILAIGAARREPVAKIYAAALAGIGAVIAAYHVALEWVPTLDSGACDPAAPCTLIWFRVFGVLSMPTLALIAFLLILVLLLVRAPHDDPDDTDDHHDAAERVTPAT